MVWQGFAGGNVTEVFLRDFYFDGFPRFQYVLGRGESELLTRQTCHFCCVRDRQFLQRENLKEDSNAQLI